MPRSPGNFDLREARDLAIVLRAGALPAPVTLAEERTVGPTLGRDSIQQGMVSFAVGGALVILFMLVYYRGAGLLADLALLLNVVFILAALAALEATVTLPGIAGLVLTLGMAVDANVLINERIREELRLGKDRPSRDRGGLRARASGDSRLEHHDVPVGPHPLPVRIRPSEGLRGHALHRPGHLGVHGRHLHPNRLRFHAEPTSPERRISI